MKTSNSVQLIGNVGGDISVNVSETGVKVGAFNVAVTERYKTSNGAVKERTDWFKVVCFGEYNGALEHLAKKGNQVMIYGSLRTRVYVDKNGISHNVVEILLEQLYLLNKKD